LSKVIKNVNSDDLPLGRKIEQYSRSHIIHNMKPESSHYQETKQRLDALKNIALQQDPEFLSKQPPLNDLSKIKFKDLFAGSHAKKGDSEAKEANRFEEQI
jgi:hypothetical protein